MKLLVLILVLIISFIVCLSFGATDVSDLFLNQESRELAFNLRLPRVLLAFIVGSGLSLCGAALQTFYRNDLCCPYTIGVSGVSALGAVIAIYLGLGSLSVEIMAIIFALIGTVALLSVSRLNIGNSTLLLVGVTLTLVSSSFIGLLQSLSGPDKSFMMLKWLEGGLEVIGLKIIFAPLIVLLFILLILYYTSKELDLIQISFDYAKGRGVNIDRVSFLIIVSVSLFVGIITAVCGPIGFIGLIVPHVARYFVRSNHSQVFILSFLIGGTVLMLLDLISRTVIAPSEVPIGIVSGIIGAPIFLLMLFRKSVRN